MMQQLSATLVPEWTLGDRLRKARETTGLDAVQLAHEMGVHRDTVANYEKEKVRPRQIVLRAWSSATGVSLDWLLTGENPRPNPGGGEGCAIRDSNPEPADSVCVHWFGRAGERRGFMPIARPDGRRHRRRRVVVPLAEVATPGRFVMLDNHAVEAVA